MLKGVGCANDPSELGRLGISQPADLQHVHPATLVFATRMLVAHDAMMRMCEHRDGMRVGDVLRQRTAAIRQIAVPEVKDKVRLQRRRIAALPVYDDVTSAGAALQALMTRVHGKSQQSDLLFPACDADGSVLRHPAPERQFKEMLRTLAADTGLPLPDVQRVRGHSLRAGGATDALAAHMNEAWVMKQGGWRSPIFRIYYRPLAADGRVMAEHLTKAALATL